MKQAIKVSHQSDETDEDIKYADKLYEYSKGDPLMFICGIQNYS